MKADSEAIRKNQKATIESSDQLNKGRSGSKKNLLFSAWSMFWLCRFKTDRVYYGLSRYLQTLNPLNNQIFKKSILIRISAEIEPILCLVENNPKWAEKNIWLNFVAGEPKKIIGFAMYDPQFKLNPFFFSIIFEYFSFYPL